MEEGTIIAAQILDGYYFYRVPVNADGCTVEACRELYVFLYNLSLSFRGGDYLITLIEEPSVYLMMFTPFCRSFTCVPARV